MITPTTLREITSLLTAADKYPLTLRIAVKLHRLGVTETDMVSDRLSPALPGAIRNHVTNYLRDIEHSFYSKDFLRNVPEPSGSTPKSKA